MNVFFLASMNHLKMFLKIWLKAKQELDKCCIDVVTFYNDDTQLSFLDQYFRELKSHTNLDCIASCFNKLLKESFKRRISLKSFHFKSSDVFISNAVYKCVY